MIKKLLLICELVFKLVFNINYKDFYSHWVVKLEEKVVEQKCQIQIPKSKRSWSIDELGLCWAKFRKFHSYYSIVQ